MKKYLTVLCSICIVYFGILFASCGKKKGDEFVSNGEFIAQFMTVNPLFMGADDAGTGFGVDVAEYIANYTGRKLTKKNVTGINGKSTAVAAIQSGKADAFIALENNNADIARTLDFSAPFIKQTVRVVTRAGDTRFDGKTKSEIEAILKGGNIKIGCGNSGNTGYEYLKRIGVFSNTDYQHSMTQSLLAPNLLNGNLDCYVYMFHGTLDGAPMYYTYEQLNSGIKIYKDIELDSENSYIAVKKGKTNVLNTINNALTKIMEIEADGTSALQKMAARYA
jgi:ABC-type amino acid transport substrate-binding protein